MRCASIRLVALILAVSPAQADTPGPSQKHHPWGRCAPGAWKIVSVVTKSIDERGQVSLQSTTETKTTLLELDDDGVMLEVRAMVETGGRRFHPEAQIIRQGFHGEMLGRDAKVKDLGIGTVTVEKTEVPCRISQIESNSISNKTVTTIYYSDAFAPHILKRLSVTTDLDGTNVLAECEVEVVAANMPCEILGEVKCATQVRTVCRHPSGTITTLAFVSPDVPGGVVAHTSKELDTSGRLTRQSVLKLVAYSFEPHEDRGVFGRKRSKHRRSGAQIHQPP